MFLTFKFGLLLKNYWIRKIQNSYLLLLFTYGCLWQAILSFWQFWFKDWDDMDTTGTYISRMGWIFWFRQSLKCIVGHFSTNTFLHRTHCNKTPEVLQSPDARLSWAFVVWGFISMISKVKKQKKNTERLKFHDFNICPNILYADA